MGAFRWRFPQFLNSFLRWRLPSSPFRRAASRLSKSIFPVSQGSQGGTRHVMKSYGRLDLRWQILRFMRKLVGTRRLCSCKLWKFEDFSHELLFWASYMSCLDSFVLLRCRHARRSCKTSHFWGFPQRIGLSFCEAGIALQDILTRLVKCLVWQTQNILLLGFQKMTCMLRGRRKTLDVVSMFIFRGRRGPLDVWCCLFFANRLVKAASSGGNLHIAWPEWGIDSEGIIVWQAQRLVKIRARGMPFCVASAILGDVVPYHCRLDPPDSIFHTFHTLPRTLHIPKPQYTLNTLRSKRRSTLGTLHSRFHTPQHSTPYTLHSTLHTPHFKLHFPDSTLQAPHLTIYTLHIAPHTPHCTLNTLHSTFYTAHSQLQVLHSTPYTLYFTLHTPNFTLHTLYSPLRTLHSPLYTLRFTLHTLNSTLYAPHLALYTLPSKRFALYAPLSTLHTLHSTLYSLHCTIHAPDSKQSTLHTPNPHITLYTLHSTWHTSHFTLYT